MQANFRDFLHLHFIVLLWGFTAILGILISIPSVETVLYRTFLASIGLGVLLMLRKRKFFPGKSAMLRMLATGALIAAHWILFFASARIATISVCLAGLSTVTLWTSLLEPLMTRRPIRWYEVALGFLVIAGLYLIFRFEFTHAWGLILAMLSALFASIFTVINGQFTQKHNGYLVTFWEMVGACASTALFLPLYAYTLAEGSKIQLSLNATDIWSLLALALVCTVYAYSASVELQKKVSAFTMNLTVNLEPIYGIILAVLLFPERERMTPGFYLGTSVILSAVLIYPLLSRWDRRRQLLVRKI